MAEEKKEEEEAEEAGADKAPAEAMLPAGRQGSTRRKGFVQPLVPMYLTMEIKAQPTR